jgi:AraC-like DNA-binding protein
VKQPVFRYIGDAFYPVPEYPLAVVTSAHGHPEPIHSHDFAELVIVREGSALHGTDLTDDSTEVCSGDAVLIAHGERHMYTNNNGLVLDNLLFRHDVFAGPSGSSTLDAFAVIEPLFRVPLTSRTVHLAEAELRRTTQCMDDIREELSARRPGFRGMASSRFVEIIVILGRAARRKMQGDVPSSTGKSLDSSVLAAEEFLRIHFPEPLTLADIAAVANLTSHHFCEVFKRKTGQTPWQFLLELRVTHARFLLSSHPTMPISHVASACGFSDPAYFARVFRTSVGVPPSSYRLTVSRT